jgi:isoleucyl-tRNA synthetase
MPFVADSLWRNLVSADESVFLVPWPEAGEIDDALLAEVADLRRVVELGRRARESSGLRGRQPLRRLIVHGAEGARSHADEIAEELRVKEVEFGEVDATELLVKPNLPVLGPKLGKELGAVRAALQAGEFEDLGDGRFRVGDRELGPDEVLVERRGLEGWAVESEPGLTVALDTTLDAALELEGRVYDLIHTLNRMRKDAGLDLTERIRVTLSSADADLLEHSERIKQETLAVDVQTDGDLTKPKIAKA